MAKRERNPERDRLVKQIITEYQPKSIMELQDVLKSIFAPLMEDMLKGELDSHLGYAKNEQLPKTTTNRRNGSFPKTVRSQLGELALDIPRDREGEFEPVLVPNGKKDVSGIEAKVLSMYARGMSDRDISSTVDEIYGFSLSHETLWIECSRIYANGNPGHYVNVIPFCMLMRLSFQSKAMGKL